MFCMHFLSLQCVDVLYTLTSPSGLSPPSVFVVFSFVPYVVCATVLYGAFLKVAPSLCQLFALYGQEMFQHRTAWHVPSSLYSTRYKAKRCIFAPYSLSLSKTTIQTFHLQAMFKFIHNLNLEHFLFWYEIAYFETNV